jgi:uncharacterized membrane protein YgcG
MGLIDLLFGSPETAASSGEAWPEPFAEQYRITLPARKLAAQYPDIMASLNAIDRYMKDDQQVVIGATTGTTMERAQGSHAWLGWLALGLKELVRHILIHGGTGSGKSSTVIYPLAEQVLNNFKNSSIFAVAIKDSAIHELVAILEKFTDRTWGIVAPGHTPWNLIYGMSPSEAAQLMAECFQGRSETNKYFTNLARRRALHALFILQALVKAGVPQQISEPDIGYDLYACYQFCYSPAFEKLCLQHATTLIGQLPAGSEKRAIEESIAYCSVEWTEMDHTQKSNVSNTLSAALGIFSDPRIRDTFAPASGIDIDTVIASGQSLIVHVPQEFRSESAALYTMMKYRFAQAVFRRPIETRDKNLVVGLLDEYQTYASDGDTELLDKSRQYNCAMILGANSFSSLVSQFSSRELALKIFENCGTKIIFDGASRDLLAELAALAGRTKIVTRSSSKNSGDSRTHAGWSSPGSSGSSGGRSTSSSESYIDFIDGELWRTAPPGAAVIFTSVAGHHIIDVCLMPKLWVVNGEADVYPPESLVWTPCETLDPDGKIKAKLQAYLKRLSTAQS